MKEDLDLVNFSIVGLGDLQEMMIGPPGFVLGAACAATTRDKIAERTMLALENIGSDEELIGSRR